MAGHTTIRLDELDAREPSWLWPGYLLRQGVNLVVGRRGLGKTMFASWLAAEATMGGWNGTPSRVYVDTREDDIRIDIRPRIEAAGGVMTLIETRKIGSAPWTFPQDLDALGLYLEARREQNRAIDLVLLDSLSAYVPRIAQPEKAAEALEGLTWLAIEFDCAVVFVHHFLKSGRSIEAAIGGSGAVQRIARTISILGEEPVDVFALMLKHLQGEDAESDVRVFASHKLNVAATPPSLKFEIEVVSLPTVEQVPVLRLIGESEYDDVAVFAQARKSPKGEQASEVDGAVEWIILYLLDRHAYACPSRLLVADGREAGFSQRTLERARAKARLVRIPPGTGRLLERLGEEAYAALEEDERRQWWVGLPELIPPPDQWAGGG